MTRDDAKELCSVLTLYVNSYPAFRSKPVGAPGSETRKNQDLQIELEDRALAILRRAELPS